MLRLNKQSTFKQLLKVGPHLLTDSWMRKNFWKLFTWNKSPIAKARSIFFLYQSPKQLLLKKKLGLKAKLKSLSNALRYPIRFLLSLKSQSSSITVKKRFPQEYLVLLERRIQKLKESWLKVTSLCQVKAWDFWEMLNSMMVWMDTEWLLNKSTKLLLIERPMLCMHSKLETHFIMVMFLCSMLPEPIFWQKDLKTQFCFCTHLVDGAKTMMSLLTTEWDSIKHFWMMEL